MDHAQRVMTAQYILEHSVGGRSAENDSHNSISALFQDITIHQGSDCKNRDPTPEQSSMELGTASAELNSSLQHMEKRVRHGTRGHTQKTLVIRPATEQMTRLTASNSNLQTANSSFYVMGSVQTIAGRRNTMSKRSNL